MLVVVGFTVGPPRAVINDFMSLYFSEISRQIVMLASFQVIRIHLTDPDFITFTITIARYLYTPGLFC